MSQPDDSWLDGERERHGPVTEDEIHAGYDAVLDAREAWRATLSEEPTQD